MNDFLKNKYVLIAIGVVGVILLFYFGLFLTA